MNYDYLVSTIRVTVPSFKESKADSSAVYFQVELEFHENKWSVEKRFSEFDELFKALKNSFATTPILPNKSFIFKMTEKELDQRRAGLEDFLQKIVVRSDLMNSDAVKGFLQLGNNASETMIEPPKLQLEYVVNGQSKGIREFIYQGQQKVFYIATADPNTISRLRAGVSNAKFPWENDSGSQTFMEVGTVEAWNFGDEGKFVKLWSKGYPKEAITISHDKASNRILVGLDDGVIDLIQISGNHYQNIACVKAHQARVTGLSFDAMSNVIYSVGMDNVFRVSHGTSIALIVGVPHKQHIFTMLRDNLNKRILFGTKTGEVYIYDISQAEKPKVLTVLQNNKHGSIRCLYLDTNRNYLFSGSYDDGELNVFDLDKPGREKLARMSATMRGKQKVRAICASAKRNQIYTGTQDGGITFWDAPNGKQIYMLQAFDTEITSLYFIQEHRRLISTSKGKSIKIWTLPKEWRDHKVVGNLIKKQNVRKKDELKGKLIDIAGWHLD